VTNQAGIVRGPGEGRALAWPNGRAVVIKAAGDETAGAYSFMELTAPVGSPWTPPHLHHNFEESMYVLAGELTVHIGDRTTKAIAGSFVLIPRGTTHSLGNSGTTDCRYLAFCSPPGLEQMWVEWAALRQSDPNAEHPRRRDFTEEVPRPPE
jgi:mannose-6-phosphate isomerase-like protein (cupin superfamily)